MKKYIFLFLLLPLAFASCREDNIPMPEPVGPDETQRTFFLYIAAENSLGSSNLKYDYQNIQSLLSGVDAEHLKRNNIVIYHDPRVASMGRPDTKPRLLEVIIDEDGTAAVEEVRVYEEQNSATGENLAAILAEVIEAYPAQKYSFLMWSHGTGWLPGNPDYTRAIGQDGDDWMNLDEFADAIPDGTFDYMLIDACYMASAEVAYVLRNKVDYIVTAPSEVLGLGMPYHRMPEYLLGNDPQLERFCDAFYEYYGGKTGDSTISLIDTEQMEVLADLVQEILADVSAEQVYAIPNTDMQWFDRIMGSAHPFHLFFDLGDYMKQFATETQYADFTRVMEEVVPYSLHSDSFLTNDFYPGFTIESYCGLSSYVPRSTDRLGKINAYYKTTEWYQAVYPAAFGL